MTRHQWCGWPPGALAVRRRNDEADDFRACDFCAHDGRVHDLRIPGVDLATRPCGVLTCRCPDYVPGDPLVEPIR